MEPNQVYENEIKIIEDQIVESLKDKEGPGYERAKEGLEIIEKEVEELNQTNLSKPSVIFSFEDQDGQLIEHVFSVEGIPSPKSIVFRPDGSEIWVASLMNKSRGIFVLDASDGSHKNDVVLPGGGAVELIFNNDGSRLYASQMETARIFEVDADTKEILRIFPTGSSWTKVLALSFNEDRIYASNWIGNSVSVIDLKTGNLLSVIPTIKTPRGIYVTNSNDLYVAGFDNGEIQKINLETGESRVLFKTGGAMRHVTGDEERGILFFSDMALGKIYTLDLLSDEVKEFVETDINPNTIALSPDKNMLIVSNRGRNHPSGNYYIPGPEWGSVLIFDSRNGKMLDALIGGNQPTGLHISPDGKLFAYSNFLDGNIKVYEIPSYEFLKTGGGGRSSFYKSELRK